MSTTWVKRGCDRNLHSGIFHANQFHTLKPGYWFHNLFYVYFPKTSDIEIMFLLPSPDPFSNTSHILFPNFYWYAEKKSRNCFDVQAIFSQAWPCNWHYNYNLFLAFCVIWLLIEVWKQWGLVAMRTNTEKYWFPLQRW